MTEEDFEDKYPHWRDALFGNNGAVANVRCAIHYGFWHGIYIALAVIGLAVVGVLTAAKRASALLGDRAQPLTNAIGRVIDGVIRVVTHERVKSAIGTIVDASLWLILIGGAIAILYLMVTHPIAFLTALGILVGAFVASLAIFFIGERIGPYFWQATSVTAQGLRTAGEKATDTPGVRRVYGKCPVSLDTTPKWFENLFPEDDAY